MTKAILLVDDDELVRGLLSIRLSAAGYRCRAVADGAAALLALGEYPADLVITDLAMPTLSGSELLARLRADPALSHIPVLILSHRSGPTQRQSAAAHGAAAFMAKPFCSAELLQLIGDLLQSTERKAVKRLKVTVMGSAALAAALPAATQAASAAAPQRPVVLAAAEKAEGQRQPPVPSTREDTVPRPLEPEPLEEARWQTRHSASLVQNYSWIGGRGDSEWHETAAAYSIRPTARSGYTAEVNRADRFGLVDTTLSLRGDWRVGERTSAFATAVVTPSADFRERWGVRAGFSHTVHSPVEIGASSRLGEFVDGKKLAVTPYVAVSTKGERLTAMAEVIQLWSLDGPADPRTGYGFRLRGQPTDRLRFVAGFSEYPEVETGITREVRSIYGGLSYDLSDSLGVSGSFARDRYQGLFTRNAASVGIVYRWRGAG